MNALAAVQSRCQQAILTGDAAPGLFISEGSPEKNGFAVYLEAYRARLTAALRDNFPVLHRALGDVAFDALASRYIEGHPSRFRSLRWFGSSLVEFLAGQPEFLPHPALVDVARMDWAIRCAFDATDATPLAFDDLAARAPSEWPATTFQFVPSMQILDLSWQVEPIWAALHDDPVAKTREPVFQPHILAIWRPALDCRWRSLEGLEAAALRAAMSGLTFSDVCSLIAESGSADPARAAGALIARWVADEMLAGVRQPL